MWKRKKRAPEKAPTREELIEARKRLLGNVEAARGRIEKRGDA